MVNRQWAIDNNWRCESYIPISKHHLVGRSLSYSLCVT